jgi:hypothetical protein
MPCVAQKICSIGNNAVAGLPGYFEAMSALVIPEDSKKQSQHALDLLSALLEPVIHDGLSAEQKDRRQNALVGEITIFLSAFPFGVRFDSTAMQAKIAAWAQVLGEKPYWAVKQALRNRMRKVGAEPSVGDFAAKDVWPLIAKMDWQRYALERALSNKK